ncbi:MAG: hypothetical protein H7039_19275 [Bryobacteraceae bacterium]|nr:hypothetical protein [Bryobacteraceae bacterium]
MPLHARAEIVAAQAVVDYVVLYPIDELIAILQPEKLVDRRDDDLLLTQSLRNHIRARYSGEK